MSAVGLPGLFDTASVYTPDPTTGEHTVLALSGLACGLFTGGSHYEGASALDRAELAAWRRLIWDPSYAMAENAQVEVDGVRYNAVPGSFLTIKNGVGSILYRRGDFVRALT